MKLWLSILIVFVINICTAQNYLSTNLTPGTHKVGFKSSIYFDPGRPPLQEQQPDSRNGRAVHISIWYPATIKADQRPMNFSTYVDDIARMINPSAVTDYTKKESLRLMSLSLSQLHGDTMVLKPHLPSLVQSTTTAYLNATALVGSSPVIVYPESSYLNNISCEYLASYGYIAVSVSRHGTFTAEFEWQTVKGIETLVQDCQFALSIVKKEFQLTKPKVAVMGIGMNASAGLAWMMRSPEVEVLVSLEGGILTAYEYNLIQKSPYFDKTRANKPMLVMHSPHEAVNADLIDQYKYADRYMLHLRQMSEFYYLNFGVWEKTMPGIVGPAPGNTKTGFEWAMKYTLNFLEWHLKQKESGRIFFDKSPAQNGVPAGVVEYTFKPRYEIPPTEAELENIKQTAGFAAMLSEVKKLQHKDPQAISFDVFITIAQRLIGAKEFEYGIQWASVFQQSYPEATSAFTIAGRCYLELGQKDKAGAFYTSALKLLPTDPNFDPGQKERMKEQIEKRLEQLKG